MTLTTTSEKKKTPTATVHQHRVRLFQPTIRPLEFTKENSQKIFTSFGSVYVLGRLGQRHADLLEAIMFKPLKSGRLEDGRIKLLVDPAILRKITGMGGEMLEKTLTELMGAVIDVEIFGMENSIRKGHLIDHVEDARTSRGEKITKKNPLGGERALWRVELGKALTDFVGNDIWMFHNPKIFKSFKNGVSRAVLRHMLSHKNEPAGGWYVDTLIRAVCGDLENKTFSKRRAEIKDDFQNFKKCGVLLDFEIKKMGFSK